MSESRLRRLRENGERHRDQLVELELRCLQQHLLERFSRWMPHKPRLVRSPQEVRPGEKIPKPVPAVKQVVLNHLHRQRRGQPTDLWIVAGCTGARGFTGRKMR